MWADPKPPVLALPPASSYPTARVRRARGLPCAPALEGEPSARVHPLLLRLLSLGWQARKAGAASPPHAASANLPSAPGPSGPGAPRSRRCPAAQLASAPRPRPRAARLRIPPGAPGALALALTSPERHMSSPGVRSVPLQRRSGRGRQTLTKCALGPAEQRGRAPGPPLGLVGTGHIAAEVC